jgi:hypothetical protein
MISQHLCLLHSPKSTIRQYSVLRKETDERAKITHKIEHVFIWIISSQIERISTNSSRNTFSETRSFSVIQEIP